MDKDFKDIVLFEIRQNRKEIAKVKILANSLKIKFGMIAIVFGFIGSLMIPLFQILK